MPALELIATGASPLEAVHSALDGWFAVRDGDAAEFDRVYYDTFDGLLYAEGLTLCWERDRLLLMRRDGTGEMLCQSFPGEPPTPLVVGSLEGELRAALEPVVDVRVLLELARVRVRSSELAVLDQLQKTVVRVQAEDPAGLRGRVRVVGLRGYERERGQVAELLVETPGLIPASMPLVDEAVLEAGFDPAGVSSDVDVYIEPEDPADEAVAAILTRLTEIRNANLAGVLDDVDTEFLHDYRVALRRTRAVVREMKGVFPPSIYGWIRGELKWLQNATGPTRDLDVYLQDFEELRELAPEGLRGDLEPLLEVLRERHLQARLDMVRDLRSERHRQLEARWADLLMDLAELPSADRPDAKEPIDALASKRIRKVRRRMVKMGRAIDADSEPEEYHELRKKGKELRYLLELFGRSLHDPDVVKPMIKTLKAMQDVLGRHQDREVQIETLRSLAEEVSRQPGGPAAVLAMGAMIERLEEDAAAARDDFHGRFEEFASEAQRRLVEDTFPA